MSDGVTDLEYGAMVTGMSVAQFAEVVENVCQALRDSAYYSAEFTSGLTFDDRRWVHDLSDVGFQPPARFAERWLQRAEGNAS